MQTQNGKLTSEDSTEDDDMECASFEHMNMGSRAQ